MKNLFNNFKKAKVQYGIFSKYDKPKLIYDDINLIKANSNLKCPAVNSSNNKFFKVNSFISIDLEIYFNESTNRLEYKYNFCDKTHPPQEVMHKFIKDMISLDTKNNQYTIQILTPYIFLTDSKDLEITTLDPSNDTYNLEFIPGSFNIYNWPRSLNLAYNFIDNNKTAKLNLSIDKPLLKYFFNLPIDLKYVDFNEKQLEYLLSNYDIVKYRKNITSLYKTHLKRRPKTILQ